MFAKNLFLDMGDTYTAVYVYENAVSCTYMIYAIFCCKCYVSTKSFLKILFSPKAVGNQALTYNSA